MSKASTNISQKSGRTIELASHLLTDIKQRRLIKGDRYLTTEQAGQMLRVSKAAANLAMQMLSSQNILIRKQRSGTFIGPAIDSSSESANGQAGIPPLDSICVVVSPERTLPATQVMAGIHQELFGMEVHFCFLPEERSVEFIRNRIINAQTAGQRVGYLLISCSQEVYLLFAQKDVPVAVIGDVYHDSHSLPSVSGDANKAGRLLIDHLLQQDHRRIALLTHSHWRPGDNYFYEGISQGLAAAGMAHDALIMRSLPNDPKEVGQEASVLLSEADPPTAIICRDPPAANTVAKAAANTGLAIPEDLAIVFGWGTEYTQVDENCSYPHVRVCPSFCRHTALAVDAIRRVHEGENLADKHMVLPVELVTPEL